jgi:hypothetical protein
VTGSRSTDLQVAAEGFATGIDGALEKIDRGFIFRTPAQQREVVDLFRRAQDVYKGMLHPWTPQPRDANRSWMGPGPHKK